MSKRMNDYRTVQFNFTDRLRQFVIKKGLQRIQYIEEFGRVKYIITIDKDKRNAVLKEFYAELGEAFCRGFDKALSHPYIKLDMCPDFDNLLILTYGRFVYRFMTSKKGKKLWADLNDKYAQKLKKDKQ